MRRLPCIFPIIHWQTDCNTVVLPIPRRNLIWEEMQARGSLCMKIQTHCDRSLLVLLLIHLSRVEKRPFTMIPSTLRHDNRIFDAFSPHQFISQHGEIRIDSPSWLASFSVKSRSLRFQIYDWALNSIIHGININEIINVHLQFLDIYATQSSSGVW